MFFTFEISRPFQRRPFWHSSRISKRCGWLWFAIGFHPMREDELLDMARRGETEWTLR